MRNYLFVYGTLKQNANNEFSLLIQQHTTYFGAGFIYAKKYDLGEYPGVKLDPSKQHKTFGELYQINGNAKDLFESLDYYEGFISNESTDNLFVRKFATVYCKGKEITTWMYEYAKLV